MEFDDDMQICPYKLRIFLWYCLVSRGIFFLLFEKFVSWHFIEQFPCMILDLYTPLYFFLMNNNLLKKGKALVHKKYTREYDYPNGVCVLKSEQNLHGLRWKN